MQSAIPLFLPSKTRPIASSVSISEGHPRRNLGLEQDSLKQSVSLRADMHMRLTRVCARAMSAHYTERTPLVQDVHIRSRSISKISEAAAIYSYKTSQMAALK